MSQFSNLFSQQFIHPANFFYLNQLGIIICALFFQAQGPVQLFCLFLVGCPRFGLKWWLTLCYSLCGNNIISYPRIGEFQLQFIKGGHFKFVLRISRLMHEAFHIIFSGNTNWDLNAMAFFLQSNFGRQPVAIIKYTDKSLYSICFFPITKCLQKK